MATLVGSNSADLIGGTQNADMILGGASNDTLSGGAGNDWMFGSGLLTGALDMEQMRITEDVTAKITFMGETAGYRSPLGIYRIADDGTIHDVEILFPNASQKWLGGLLVPGVTSVDVDLAAGDRVGFFIVPNAYVKPGMAALLEDLTGQFKFVDATGNDGTVDGSTLTLVHVGGDGTETDIQSQFGTQVLHSLLGQSGMLNADGRAHVSTNVDVEAGTVAIGFEDILAGDFDFDDISIRLDIGTINAAPIERLLNGGVSSADQDVMDGGSGDDIMFGMADDDLMSGGTGNDRLWGNAGNDTVSGGSGNDLINGNAGNDRLSGNSGDDTISGGDGNDLIKGGSGNDLIGDGAGNDTVAGGSGSDTFVMGTGDDIIAGGSGFDTIDFSLAGSGVIVDMSEGSATGAGYDSFSSIEAVIGSNYADALTGSTRSDVLSGGAGDDAIAGGQGDDTISDGAGNDTVAGGSGNDTFMMGAGDDQIVGGAGFDTIDFSLAGASVSVDMSANTAISAATGTDRFSSIEAVTGSNYADTLSGSTRSEAIAGGAGDDIIRGGRGDDTLTGGSGDDRFVYYKSDIVLQGSAAGTDVITDFGIGHDMLDLSDALKHEQWTAIGDVVTLADDGANTTVFAHIGSATFEVAVLQNFTGYSAADMLSDDMLLV